MEVLKEHIIPVVFLLLAAALTIVAEFLFGKRVIKVGEKTASVVSTVAMILTVLIGAAFFIYLTVIGAGVEIMLPVMLLVLLGTLI
ncbi:MAG: hypothetical protein IJU46_03215 [Clostridia bacterium]|nr:hypothetical protein [Clostridia bacterium]